MPESTAATFAGEVEKTQGADANADKSATIIIWSEKRMANTNLGPAIEEQRTILFSATAMIDTVTAALIGQFGAGWPAGIPEYPRVLQHARNMIDDAAGKLERVALEDRAAVLAHESYKASGR
jgi:ABC-type branched-subunit amino acid transport system ATPase component